MLRLLVIYCIIQFDQLPYCLVLGAGEIYNHLDFSIQLEVYYFSNTTSMYKF